MEERQVTAAGQIRPLDAPFYVFATQNPIELEGTYPLPEAQLDRFMFNIRMDYLTEDEELEVVNQTTANKTVDLKPVFTGEEMREFMRLIRSVPVAEPIARYAVQLSQASRPTAAAAPDFITQYVSWGAGTRGSQNLVLAAKARALLKGHFHVSLNDIEAVAPPVFRHRILTNFRAEADRVTVEDIIQRLLTTVAKPKSGLA
jgi:MoxR-like ATPase